MERTRSWVLGTLVSLTAVAMLIPAATAQTATPQFRNERTYVHCGATKSAQFDWVSSGFIATWDTTAPTRSVQAGAGCGSLELPGLTGIGNATVDPATDLTWEGKFTGNLDSFTVHPHAIWGGGARAAGKTGFTIELTIDGEVIPLALDDQDNQAVEVTPIASSTGASSEMEFSITNLGYVEPLFDADGDGVIDNPTGIKEHTIRLKLNSYYIDQNPAVIWVWDTTEVPSGIDFNPPTLSASRIAKI